MAAVKIWQVTSLEMANKAFVYKEEEETQEGENAQYLFIFIFHKLKFFFPSAN